MVMDLSNEMPSCKNWDPRTLHSPIQPKVPPSIYKKDETKQLQPAKPMSVSILTSAQGRVDCFIDDIIKVVLDRPGNVANHAVSAPLAIYACMRPYVGTGLHLITRTMKWANSSSALSQSVSLIHQLCECEVKSCLVATIKKTSSVPR